ncbi:hypothetical protein JST97_33515 [bacterium]|nr:hypothetical protein [bacterium]
MILTVTGLRKGGEILQHALELWRAGQPLLLPTECGYRLLGEGDLWLSAHPPELPQLEKIFQTFWPGPLCLRLPHQGGKRRWLVPSHPLAQAFLKLANQPVPSAPCPADYDGPRLEWKDPPLALSPSEVDCASHPWRWLESGFIERQEFEWVAGQPTLLSGPALPRRDYAPAPIFREAQTYRVEP